MRFAAGGLRRGVPGVATGDAERTTSAALDVVSAISSACALSGWMLTPLFIAYGVTVR